MYRPVAISRDRARGVARQSAHSPLLLGCMPPAARIRRPCSRNPPMAPTISAYMVGPHTLRLSTDAPVRLHPRTARFSGVEGDLHFFLGPDEPFTGNLREEIRRMEQATRKYWQHWVRSLATPFPVAARR